MEKTTPRPCILVPLNGRAANERVLPIAAKLSRAMATRLVLLRVTWPQSDHGAEQKIKVESAREYFAGLAASLRQRELDVDTHVEWAHSTGEIPIMIADTAATQNAILIIMPGSIRHVWIPRMALSMAERMIVASPVPVWLIPTGNDPIPWTSRLVGPGLVVSVDGSSADETALVCATDLARSLRAQLSLVYAVSPLAVTESAAYTYRLVDDILNYRCDQGRLYVAGIADRLRQQGLIVRTRVQIGGQGQVILDEARQHSSAVIVLAADFQTPWRRWLWGSPVDELVWEHVGPVVTIHGNQKSREPRILRQDSVQDRQELPANDPSPAGAH
jgi:nucleotide-binding universal stress UspA family protein